jgi:hypothetical protein
LGEEFLNVILRLEGCFDLLYCIVLPCITAHCDRVYTRLQ